VQYALRIIGFVVHAVRMLRRKIHAAAFNGDFEQSEDVLVSARANKAQRASKKNL